MDTIVIGLIVLAVVGFVVWKNKDRLLSKPPQEKQPEEFTPPLARPFQPGAQAPVAVAPSYLDSLPASTRAHMGTAAASPMKYESRPADSLGTFGQPTIAQLKASHPQGFKYDYIGWVNFGMFYTAGTDDAARVAFATQDITKVLTGIGGEMVVECKGPGVLTVSADKDTTFHIVTKAANRVIPRAEKLAARDAQIKAATKPRK